MDWEGVLAVVVLLGAFAAALAAGARLRTWWWPPGCRAAVALLVGCVYVAVATNPPEPAGEQSGIFGPEFGQAILEAAVILYGIVLGLTAGAGALVGTAIGTARGRRRPRGSRGGGRAAGNRGVEGSRRLAPHAPRPPMRGMIAAAVSSAARPCRRTRRPARMPPGGAPAAVARCS